MIKVTCAIIEQKDHVLITQRSDSMPDPLLWEFPGGKVEKGETEEECLLREIKEELDIKVLPLRRLTPVIHKFTTKTIELVPYVCSFTGGTIDLLEHRVFEWAHYAELLSYNWCLPDVPVVNEYIQLKQAE